MGVRAEGRNQKSFLFNQLSYARWAKMEATITVMMPLVTMERELIAPSVCPISMALVVPMTCEAEPMAIPLATGFMIPMRRRNRSAKMLPMMPVNTITIMVTGTLPPSSSDTPIPMAVVMDLGRRVTYDVWSRSRMSTMASMDNMLESTPEIMPRLMA